MSQIRKIIEYCCCNRARAAHYQLSSQGQLQKCLIDIMDVSLFLPYKSIFHRRNAAGLFLLYRYFDGKSLLVPSVSTFVAGNRNSRYTGSNHSHSLRVPSIRRNFPSDSYFPGIAILQKRTPKRILQRLLQS